MAFSKPSPHRCKILTVSRLLSKEDVDEILYLSEDFIPQSGMYSSKCIKWVQVCREQSCWNIHLPHLYKYPHLSTKDKSAI